MTNQYDDMDRYDDMLAAIEDFYWDNREDLGNEDELDEFCEYVFNKTDFEEQWAIFDPSSMHRFLVRRYEDYARDFETPLEEMVSVANSVSAKADAIAEFLSNRWDGPEFPFVVSASTVQGVDILCADINELVLDAQRFIGYDEASDTFDNIDEDYDFDWVDKRLEAFATNAASNAVSYKQWLTDNPVIVLSWLNIQGDYDVNTDRFYFKDDISSVFDFENLPIDYLVEHAVNTYDISWEDGKNKDAGYQVYRVPNRFDVLDVFAKSKFVQEYMDFPYCLKNNWVEKKAPTKIEDVDDLMAYASMDLVGDTTEHLISENLGVSDPTTYVASMLAYKLHLNKPKMMPLIKVSNLASGLWSNITGGSKKKSGDGKFSVWNAMMGK